MVTMRAIAVAIIVCCGTEGVVKCYGHGLSMTPTKAATTPEGHLAERWSYDLKYINQNQQDVESVASIDEPTYQTSQFERPEPHCAPTVDVNPKVTATRPTKTSTAGDNRSRGVQMDAVPAQKPKRGKAQDPIEEKRSEKRELLPLFVYLSWLIAVFFVCNAFGNRMAARQDIVTVTMRPVIVLQDKIFLVVIDITLLALFGASVRHLGHCSEQDSSCNPFSLDSTAVCTALGSRALQAQGQQVPPLRGRGHNHTRRLPAA